MKRKIVILSVPLIMLVLFFLRVSYDKSELKNLRNGQLDIIGHAGMGFPSWMPFNALPDNSMAALKKSIIEEQADGVEVDLQMSKDGRFILYHDDKLDSKTNLKGCISEKNHADLVKAKYKVGIPFDWFQEETLIDFPTLLRFFKEQNDFPLLQIDVRNKSICKTIEENADWEKKMASRLNEILQKEKIPINKVTIISLSREFTEAMIDLKTPYKMSFEIVGEFERGLEFVQEKNIKSVTVKPKLLTQEKSALIHAKGIEVITFGAKSKRGNKNLLELNPDVIQTNNIEALIELMED